MKKLNNDLIKENLFINTEKVYGKELIDKLRKLIFVIGCAIINDEYLVDKDESDE